MDECIFALYDRAFHLKSERSWNLDLLEASGKPKFLPVFEQTAYFEVICDSKQMQITKISHFTRVMVKRKDLPELLTAVGKSTVAEETPTKSCLEY